ncbi:DUF559 domain-containing protein [Psychrobacillus sp. FSL K6-2843]|uniref:DUF559 domain-containing protein n=1 Tax=Psychrobacillus sp. FSL K6-2843 TaxID=2921549 RepID=UPI00315A0EC1
MTITKPCEVCGLLVTRSPAHMKKDKIYCSKSCFYSRNRGGLPDSKACLWCDNIFKRTTRESWTEFERKQYCSYECYWQDSNNHHRPGASNVFKHKWANDKVFIGKMSKRVYGVKHSKGVSDGLKGRKFTEKEIEKIRETTKRTWTDQEIRTKRIQEMARSFRGCRKTSIEIIVEEILVKLNVEFDIQKHISGFVADFFIQSAGAVIEADGNYWHSRPEVIERDNRKNKAILSDGYKLLRLTETEIKQDPTNKIKEFLGIE